MSTRPPVAVLAVALLVFVAAGGTSAMQAAPQAGPPAPTGSPSPRAAQRGGSARPTTMVVAVTDPAGAPLPGVSIAVNGPVTRSASSGDIGSVKLTGIRAGTYRLRFEKRGYVVLEREVVARGTPIDIEVTLTPAPEPEPAPAPPPAESTPAPASDAIPGEPRSLVVADFVERNFIASRQPAREDQLGCTASAKTTLLQVREPTGEAVRQDADEVIYVVAGEGTLRLGDRDVSLRSSSVAVVPRGTARALTRKGRNPLIVLSVVSGPACTGGK